MTCQEAEPLLSARLDDELDISSGAAVDRHLSECDVCLSRYTALQQLHQEIAAAGLGYIPSRELERKVAAPTKPFLSIPFNVWRYASLGASAVALALLFFYLPGRTPLGNQLTAEILDNHLRALQPNHLVDIPSSDRHTVKPWFQGKTSFSPPTPDLTDQGFILVGGRLEIIHQQTAAAIVYMHGRHVISLYVSEAAGANDANVETHDLQGYHVLRWSRFGVNYWAVSDLNAAELRKFADLIAAAS